MDRDAAIRKLKKMATKVESLEELGSEVEAASFAKIMQDLAAHHQVELSELRPEDQNEIDPMERVRPNYVKHGVKVRKRHVDWLQDLGETVANSHYCRLLVVRGTSMVVFAGRKSQAQLASEVYLRLAAVAETIADKEYVKHFYDMKREGDERRARGFRTSFLLGFCSRMRVRYAEYVEAVQEYFSHDTKALRVLRDSYAEVDAWLLVEKVGVSKAKHKRQVAENAAGWRRGRDVAEDVDLSGNKRLT